MLQPAIFNRGLSERFMEDLLDGDMASVLEAARAHGLDFQIRENYINVYYKGLSLLKLEQIASGAYRAEIHSRYLGDPPRRGSHFRFDADAGFARWYFTQVPSLRANADARKKQDRELAAEYALIANSLRPGSEFVIIDRQVTMHGPEDRQADVVALTQEETPRFVIGEVKWRLNNDIKNLPGQLRDYYEMLVDEDGRLAEHVAPAFRRVVDQKQRLGMLPDDLRFPEQPPPVECLVILCNYKQHSDLLNMARTAAQACDFPIHLVQPPGPDFTVPPLAEWESL